MKKHHKISLFVVLSAVLLGLAALFVPWKIAMEHKLQQALAEKGFENATVTLSGLGLHEARLKNITIGQEKKIGLENLSIGYDLKDLWNGNLRRITLDGLVLEIVRSDGRWSLQGYRPGIAGKTPSGSFPPVTEKEVSALPLDTLLLANSRLNIAGDTWGAALPLQGEWNKPIAEVSLISADPRLSLSDAAVTADQAAMRASFNKDKARWQGEWSIKNLKVARALPLMQIEGPITLDDKNLILSGKMKSDDSIYSADFSLTLPLTGGEPSFAVVKQAVMRWKSGTVSVGNLTIPLSGAEPIRFVVRIKNISVDELMQALTGKRVSATGLVSGQLPVTVGRDGSFSFGQGTLQNNGAGTITMPADAIPGDNPQVQLTRDILKNFHYQNLAISVKNDKNGGIALLLALEGNNPDIYEGRPVKLNVNLSGDVLDFIKENAMLMSSPETILRQGNK